MKLNEILRFNRFFASNDFNGLLHGMVWILFEPLALSFSFQLYAGPKISIKYYMLIGCFFLGRFFFVFARLTLKLLNNRTLDPITLAVLSIYLFHFIKSCKQRLYFCWFQHAYYYYVLPLIFQSLELLYFLFSLLLLLMIATRYLLSLISAAVISFRIKFFIVWRLRYMPCLNWNMLHLCSEHKLKSKIAIAALWQLWTIIAKNKIWTVFVSEFQPLEDWFELNFEDFISQKWNL